MPHRDEPCERGLRHELSVMRQSDVLLAIATTILSSASVFTLFTYIVPILQDVTGFTPANVTLILFMIGIGLTFGITLGGKFSDRGPMRAMITMLAGMRACCSRFCRSSFTARSATLVVIFLWAMAAFGTVPGLQSRVVDKATERAEPRLHAQHRRVQSRQRRRRVSRRPRHRSRVWPDGSAVAAAIVALLTLAGAVLGTLGDRR